MGRLDGKVLLIFGGGPNNGGTIAHFMAREGAKVVVADLKPEIADETANFLTERGYDAIAMSGDASDEKTVEDTVKKTVDHFGSITTMVNLAGRQTRWAVTDIDLEQWNDQLRTYLTSGMLTTKHAARAMVAGNVKGCIIHLISTAGHFGEAGNAGYSAAKGGLLMFARAAAMDLAHQGVRVNTVTPYAMEHNLWRAGPVKELPQEQPQTQHSVTRNDVIQQIPLERFPRASDLAWAAVYLASDEAEFLTGVDIPVDGGTKFKYPSWTPGHGTEVNADDYRKSVMITRYGEETEPYYQPDKA